MEEKQSLFSLSIDPVTKTHLAESARWAKFLAIVALVFLVFMTAFVVYTSTTINRYETTYGNTSLVQSLGVGMAVMYLVFAVIAFFPILYMLRFANEMKRALAANDQNTLNHSFQNLKVYFRYLGIVTIISLLLMGLTMK
jgi:hypothetical protein